MPPIAVKSSAERDSSVEEDGFELAVPPRTEWLSETLRGTMGVSS
jgi:hypothetical protein